MRRFQYIILSIVMMAVVVPLVARQHCPVPLYTDPIYKGVADPEVVWNKHEQEWWVFYTSRRSVCEGGPLPALAIGVASSKDWIEWKHEGYIKIDGVGGEAIGPDVLWAPGIVMDGDTYHMFLTYKKGNGRGGRWGISESLILHLKAPADDLLYGWQTYGILDVPFTAIDATLMKRGDEWNLLHRDLVKGQPGVNTFRITTPSLDIPCSDWNYVGACKGDINDRSVTGYGYQEGQYLFYWKGSYWMFTDNTSCGLPLYRSDDMESWKFMGELLQEDGKAESQKGPVRHPGVVVLDDRAFVFYFCQPYMGEKKKDTKIDPSNPISEYCVLQVTELEFKDGRITADRDKRVLPPKDVTLRSDNWGFKGE